MTSALDDFLVIRQSLRFEAAHRSFDVLGMKCFGDHYILDSGAVKPIEALHYCLNLPIAVQITGINNLQILDQAIEAARTFKPLSQAEVTSLLERTKPLAEEGKLELYKTTNHFDGTAHNPKWLG